MGCISLNPLDTMNPLSSKKVGSPWYGVGKMIGNTSDNVFDTDNSDAAKARAAMPTGAPDYNPPTAPTGIQQYVEQTYGSGWSDEYKRHMEWSAKNQPGNDTRSYDQWLREGLAGNKSDDLWKDSAISSFVSTGTFTKPETTPTIPDMPEVPNTPLTPNPVVDDTPTTTTPTLPVSTVSAPTPLAPIPPVTDQLSEIVQAGREAKRAAKEKKGAMSTLLAGETGGFQGTAPSLLGVTDMQGKSLLGQ